MGYATYLALPKYGPILTEEELLAVTNEEDKRGELGDISVVDASDEWMAALAKVLKDD